MFVKDISLGYEQLLILIANGDVYGCGNSRYGELGTSTDNINMIPFKITSIKIKK
jgi:alpha-tubulin suppressor-like RCC1 family protein